MIEPDQIEDFDRSERGRVLIIRTPAGRPMGAKSRLAPIA